MNVSTEIPQRENLGTGGFGNTFRRGFEPIRDTASDAIQYGERMVQNHPETAVFSSLLLGFLAGGMIGFLLGGMGGKSTGMKMIKNDLQSDLKSLLGQLQGKVSDLF
jgi:hypothetical protein